MFHQESVLLVMVELQQLCLDLQQTLGGAISITGGLGSTSGGSLFLSAGVTASTNAGGSVSIDSGSSTATSSGCLRTWCHALFFLLPRCDLVGVSPRAVSIFC